MKVKSAVAVLVAFFVVVAGAQAFQWHMTYGQAKRESKEFAKQLCRQDRACTGFAVGPCRRMSSSRFDCEVGTFYADTPEVGEELECNVMLHWGANRSGYIVLKRYGRPHCLPV